MPIRCVEDVCEYGRKGLVRTLRTCAALASRYRVIGHRILWDDGGDPVLPLLVAFLRRKERIEAQR